MIEPYVIYALMALLGDFRWFFAGLIIGGIAGCLVYWVYFRWWPRAHWPTRASRGRW